MVETRSWTGGDQIMTAAAITVINGPCSGRCVHRCIAPDRASLPLAGCSGLQCDGLRRYFHSLYSQQECLKKDTSINVSSKHKIIALCLLKM